MAIRKDKVRESWVCRIFINKRGEVRVYIPRELARILIETEGWEDKLTLEATIFKPSADREGSLWLAKK